MSLFETPVYVGNTYKDIHISSVKGQDDNFIISLDHDGKKNDIFARIYHCGEKWFIWYEKLCCRFAVKNVTEAISILEKEILKCMA